MRYEGIQENEDANKERYFLRKDGKNNLIIIGVNPSKATHKNSDPTMNKVMGFTERNGFDGFIMLNLYPQRCSNPKNLDKEMRLELHQKNMEIISNIIKDTEKPTILVAFGDVIMSRSYLKDCLKSIVSLISTKNPQWKQIGQPTLLGNPRHPSRAKYCEFEPFDINNYLNSH